MSKCQLSAGLYGVDKGSEDRQRLMRTMLKLGLLLVTLGLASQARAQGPAIAAVKPVLEGGIGSTYMMSNVPSQGNMAMKGVLVSAGKDLNARFGVKLAVGYSRSFDAFQTGRSADLLTYMGGPVVYPVRWRKFAIHAQVLAGGARETGVNFESDGTLVRGYVHHLAWAGGAGFEFRISDEWSLRPEVEYLRTAFFDSIVAVQGHPNLRASVSMVHTFGRSNRSGAWAK